MLVQSLTTVLLLTHLCESREAPYVTIDSTKIIGHYKRSHQGNDYEAYEGVPYALPPTGDRRFELPEPIKSWPSVIVANETRELCYQQARRASFPAGSLYGGSEDCLYLNIYAPSRKSEKNYPVIFYIHGGAFIYGGSLRDGSYYLIDHEVIFVSVYYRLGVLGFLSTEDEALPGNMGLKDQALALRWVHDNIRHFNGDPGRITLAGLSAGGASVHFHYLSDMSKGLFRNGISFSGSAFNCWTLMEKSREKAFRLAEIVGCARNDTRAMIECFKRLPARTLVEAEAQFMPWRMNPFTPFGPVVERSSKRPFIDRSPIDVVTSGDAYDVPWVASVVSEEGLYPVGEYATSDTILREIDEHWLTIAPYLLDYFYTIPLANHTDVAKKIRKYYFGDKRIDRESLDVLIHLVGDRIFSADASKASRTHAKHSKAPVWFYYYSHRANFSFTDTLSNSTENFGVSHADDVLLVIADPAHISNELSEKDRRVQRDLIKIWSSMAKEGVPKLDAEWSSVDANADGLNYLHIAGPDDLKMRRDDDFGRLKFWSSINFDENKMNSL